MQLSTSFFDQSNEHAQDISFQVINIKRSSPEIRAQLRIARTSNGSPFCCSGIGSHRLSCWSHSEFVTASTCKNLNVMDRLKL